MRHRHCRFVTDQGPWYSKYPSTNLLKKSTSNFNLKFCFPHALNTTETGLTDLEFFDSLIEQCSGRHRPNLQDVFHGFCKSQAFPVNLVKMLVGDNPMDEIF